MELTDALDSDESARFRHRIKALPQELYDKIFEPTFTFEGGTCAIDKTYKPPATLQVDATTRRRATQIFYAQTKFEVKQRSDACNWLSSLSYEHQRLLHVVRYDPSCAPYPPRGKLVDGDCIAEQESQMDLWYALDALADEFELAKERHTFGVRISLDFIGVCIHFEDEEEAVWTSRPDHYLDDVKLKNLKRLGEKYYGQWHGFPSELLEGEDPVVDDKLIAYFESKRG